MSLIHVLSDETINRIAAGEVVERPANVVKELVENAIDSGADAITVEIKDGGISMIRVTDNGSGISREDIPKAFLRHATSKIEDSTDLLAIRSLGFRGEALSSIAAVCQVELMTKSKDSVIGTRYVIEGSKEIETKDVGVPSGTTIIVKNIFFNTPARRKFLKSPITEGGYIADLLEHLALANPDISFKFISGSDVKFHTSGNGDKKELIYRLFGKDAASNLVKLETEKDGLKLEGYLGKPELNRSTRNYENYFVNGRYVKNDVISSAVEEGYREYLMQHRFPFFVLYIEMDPKDVDVNVHPAKMEVRFKDNVYMSDYISSAVASKLKVTEMIPETVLVKEEEPKPSVSTVEPFEEKRISKDISAGSLDIRRILGESVPGKEPYPEAPEVTHEHNVIKASDAIIVNTSVQMELFDDKLLSRDAVAEYEIVGQIFETYWLFTYKDKLIMMDQHAAHEKVKYESLLAQMKNKDVVKQMISPAIVITLSPTELSVLNDYKQNFTDIGFEIEEFGGSDISLRAIPMDLYGQSPKELFLNILDELGNGRISGVPEAINDKLASMACKSAVKGNTPMSAPEIKELLAKLLTLDNPYNCPHGRPTMITMSKSELEKRFKRIV
ncbi:MAG: DNA mismatch repair endonuclease MutL [Lachnospiraceae bacterium]|nr:DNA mismatch repair endonuclease MutL [Lachnospiraceae bacterium]